MESWTADALQDINFDITKGGRVFLLLELNILPSSVLQTGLKRLVNAHGWKFLEQLKVPDLGVLEWRHHPYIRGILDIGSEEINLGLGTQGWAPKPMGLRTSEESWS